MKKRTSKKNVLRQAELMAGELKAHWPEIVTEIGFETQEGEDAYLWITTSAEYEDDIRADAADLTVNLYEMSGLYIPPRVIIRR
jgi:hypothetical protein